MNFVVLSNHDDISQLKNAAPGATWIKAENISSFLSEKNADAYINLTDNSSDADYSSLTAPVFINSMTKTLSEINAPENVIRINAWKGFTEKEIWEVAGKITPTAEAILTAMGKKFIALNDEPGFVTARVIAMIINEAYFAKGGNISSEADIDAAMKLGTNYPFGPFEWGRLIGLKNIYSLLKKLSETDSRYTPAPALEDEMNNI